MLVSGVVYRFDIPLATKKKKTHESAVQSAFRLQSSEDVESKEIRPTGLCLVMLLVTRSSQPTKSHCLEIPCR